MSGLIRHKRVNKGAKGPGERIVFQACDPNIKFDENEISYTNQTFDAFTRISTVHWRLVSCKECLKKLERF